MKNAIILHGMPDKDEYYDPQSPAQSNKHWLPWIQRQLTLKDILAQSIELPKPYEPNYNAWKQVFEQFHVNEDTILIGHSCGAGFLVRWLSENKVKTSQLALVAPWINPDKVDLHLVGDFFEFKIDPTVADRVTNSHIFISTDEPYEDVTKSAQILHELWPNSSLVTLSNHGHFTLDGMGTIEFPELAHTLGVSNESR